MWTAFSPLIVLNCISLFQHLESAPKEILGDFPRFTREAAAAIVFKTEAKHKGWLDNLDDDMPDHARNQVSIEGILQIVKSFCLREAKPGTTIGQFLGLVTTG